MSVAAYKTNIREVESPRNIERRILARITGQIEAHAAAYDAADTKAERLSILAAGLSAAVSDNIRFWLAIRTDLATEGNRLPPELRASLISLALWVERRSTAILGGDGGAAALVSTNRAIVSGLAGVAPRPTGAEV
jgi:flagellar protein FlaF